MTGEMFALLPVLVSTRSAGGPDQPTNKGFTVGNCLFDLSAVGFAPQAVIFYPYCNRSVTMRFFAEDVHKPSCWFVFFMLTGQGGSDGQGSMFCNCKKGDILYPQV